MRPLPEGSLILDNDTPLDIVEPIAVVGIAGRFAQDALTTQDLWNILLKARSTWSAIPKERFNSSAFYHPDPEYGGTFHVQGGHFLTEDPSLFDSSFFHITKNEVLTLDPQQRLVMENVYHALENAGIPMARAIGTNTSVFVSGFNHDYQGILNMDPESAVKYKPTGTSNSILSNRVSWFFDFKGSSMTIDTACSSSLVALNLAVQSLRSRETTMSVVSGVSLLENPLETAGYSHHGLLGAQGKSFSFDARAEGYARGEGVATVILKPLKDAVRDGDVIRAVIRETGVNQDGRTPGLTVPSGEAQESLIREVYRRAGLSLQHTHFVEAHGTGTRTGDPIEAKALAQAFNCQRDGPLHIGSLKSTIGHTEGGSGIASLIKAIFVLESGIIPANCGLRDVNPEILAKEWNINFPSQNTPWPTVGLRRVSVNSFGIGGTNAHCVLDDAYNYLSMRRISASHSTSPIPQNDFSLLPRSVVAIKSEEPESDGETSEVDFSETPITQSCATTPLIKPVQLPDVEEVLPQLFLLTAFDEDGITRNASSYAHYLEGKDPKDENYDDLLRDLSFTISTRRSLFPWKSFVMASTVKELEWSLSEGNFPKPIRSDGQPEVTFAFTGQGAQYSAMGKSLLSYPVFRRSMEEAAEYFQRLGGDSWSLLEQHAAEGPESRVNDPEIAQPLLTALQIAFVELLASWGIFPTRVIGHSSGEIAAAYCAGRISREAAWKVSYHRGYLSSRQQSSNGSMMAVGLCASKLAPLIQSVCEESQGSITIACYNSPSNNTVSGDTALLDKLQILLESEGVFVRRLKVENAYHSYHMEKLADEYLEMMGCLDFGKCFVCPHEVRMFSTLTGDEAPRGLLPSQYWVDNMVSAVRFTDGLKELVSSIQSHVIDGSNLSFIVEIGPHSTLQSAIKETIPLEISQGKIKYQSLLNRNDPSLNTFLGTVGFLVTGGCQVNLHKINMASSLIPDAFAMILVDLPPYSFKHTERVLYEGRLSKNIRFRKFPRHNLFGAPVTDWDANAPRWRHFVRLEENPWLRDHVVAGNVVYPGVGYLVMAIEASRQLAGQKALNGFDLRQIFIRRALIVPDTKHGIEVCISLTTESSSEHRLWRRFRISSYNEIIEDWTEHCTGLISLQERYNADSISNYHENEAEAQEIHRIFDNLGRMCDHPMDFSKHYDKLRGSGLEFGTLFRNLHDVKVSHLRPGEMIGSVTVPDTANSMPKTYAHPHLIHPATMDSMIHMMIAAVIHITGRSSLDKIRLPTFIHDMWISADLNCAPGHKFEGHASVRASAGEKFDGKIRIFDSISKAHKIIMNEIELTPLETGAENTLERQICTKIDWKPDVNFLDSEKARALSQIGPIDESQSLTWTKRLQMVTMICVVEALNELGDLEITSLPPHLQRFHEWMQHVRQNLTDNKIIHLPLQEFDACFQDNSLRQAIFEEVANQNSEGALTIRMGKNIVAVMRQEADPLQLMFGQDNLMEELYSDTIRLYNLPQHFQSYLSLLSHQHSQLRILEVGGGTGSVTAEVLSVLAPNCDTLNESITSYVFTDVSSGFFEKAKDRFQGWKDIMTFQVFDLEKEPTAQGFEMGSFDLIFGGNVIHATSDLTMTLRKLRSLLRPGGKLIMQEGNRQDFLWYPLVFGQLSGWWLGIEPIRKWCPYIPASAWEPLLIDSGFSGVDIEYPDCEREDLGWQSIMVSTALDSVKLTTRNAYIICDSGKRETSKVAAFITQVLEDTGFDSIRTLEIADIDQITFKGSICISLVDMEAPSFFSPSNSQYQSLQKMLINCEQLLWITPDPTQKLFASTSIGLLRTLRSERDSDNSNIVTLTVSDPQNVSAEDLAIWACGIIKHQFCDGAANDQNAEYLLRDDMIHIGRLRRFQGADKFLALRSGQSSADMTRIADIQRPICLQSFEPTGADMRWVTDSQHEEPIVGARMKIKIHAVGFVPRFESLHMPVQAAGIILQVGPLVRDFDIGDSAVFLISGTGDRGYFQTSTILEDYHDAVKVPSHIPLEVAAGLPATFVTAIYCLGHIAKLSLKDAILIHAGASALGQAAIQYAIMIGAEIITTVSNLEDKQFLTKVYGIPQANILFNNDLDFYKGVMRCTNGSGADVIFSTLTGDLQQETLSCIASFGRFVNASGKVFQPYATLAPASILKTISISNFDLDLLLLHRPEIVQDLVRETIRLFSEGKFAKIQPFKVMGFSEIKSGIESIKSAQALGEIVFVPSTQDLIPVVPEILPPLKLDGKVSYLLAGGLGGLGRSIARWMASRGAKDLIFLSRSGRVTDKTTEMISDLKDMGCNAHIFICDVLDRARMSLVMENCLAKLPPIKGCIQCSMVLQDGAFERMSLDAWKAAVQPKVEGSWNLHETLPRDLDFFLMLSSVAGIFGNPGQANYAAGNTFQDSLAAYRAARGMNASVIDLGSVSGVGWVAENHRDTGRSQSILFQLLHKDEVHGAIEFMIDPRYSKGENYAGNPVSQLVLGLPTAELCRQNSVSLPNYISYSLFTHQRSTMVVNHEEPGENNVVSTAALLAATSTLDEAIGVASNGIVEKLAALLAIPVAEIDPRKFGFSTIDSLVAMEFRSWIKRELGAEVSILDIMGAVNIRSLAEKIADSRAALMAGKL